MTSSLGDWVQKILRDHDEVLDVSVVSENTVEVTRKSHAPVVVVATALARVGVEDIQSILNGDVGVDAIINVPKEAYITGEAIRLGEESRVLVGGISELKKALNFPSLVGNANRDREYIERMLRVHTAVDSFKMLTDRSYLVRRSQLRADLSVAFLNEYALTADHVRVARERYGQIDFVVTTNPYGKISPGAVEVGRDIGVRVLGWRHFMGALNS